MDPVEFAALATDENAFASPNRAIAKKASMLTLVEDIFVSMSVQIGPENEKN